MQLSEKDFEIIACALDIVARQFHADAATSAGTPSVAAQFLRQEEDARELAQRIEDRED